MESQNDPLPTSESRTNQTEIEAPADDLGIELVPERITIEVLKQLVRENPRKMAYAAILRPAFQKLACLFFLLGEDGARLLMNELDEHEKQVVLKHIAGLNPVSLDEQTQILREFTENALLANASVFSEVDFAKKLSVPPEPESPGSASN